MLALRSTVYTFGVDSLRGRVEGRLVKRRRDTVVVVVAERRPGLVTVRRVRSGELTKTKEIRRRSNVCA